MSITHTPGPWKATPSIAEEGYECYWIESDDEFRNPIADVRGPQDAENFANARLIAAAPELLACLKVFVDNDGIGPRAMFDDAEDAIRKATGE